MRIRRLVQGTLGAFGYELRAVTGRRDDPFAEQKLLVSAATPVIFDVGAHHGQTALLYARLFPTAAIFSFEPSGESYRALLDNVRPYKNIRAFNIALGGKSGKTTFHHNRESQTNSLLPSAAEGADVWGRGMLETDAVGQVDVTTLDDFMESHSIDRIDILKMDAQGGEFLIMEGAKRAVSEKRIRVVYTEIITLPTYGGQKEFDEMLRIYRENGFSLYNLFNPSLTDDGRLRQVDAVFTGE
jgi:FkbM family methyltransferase